jgi:MFS family permease
VRVTAEPGPVESAGSVNAFAEPTEPVERSWVASLTLASVGMWAATLGPIQVLLPLQATALAPGHDSLVFGVVSAAGAAVSVVANPVFGAWSDRTTSRYGRRLPWVALGTLAGALSLLLLAWAPNVWVMTLGWCLAQAALNAILAAVSAAVPDRVPVDQRGVVGGWLGVAQTIGIVAGAGVATATGGVAVGYIATAVLLVVLAVPYCVRSRDQRIYPEQIPPLTAREFLAKFWISPRLYPDFAWAWVTRFAVNLGNFLGTLYLLFFLRDEVGFTSKEAEAGFLVLSLIYAVALVATTVAGGIWSDQVGRRKPFVIASGVVTGVAALILVAFPTWPGAVAGAVVLGGGFGVYLSVDFALVTEVLPAAVDRARDLGIINVAVTLPQVVAPAIATPIVALTGGYRMLYLASGVVAIVGSLFVRRIVSVD